MYLSLIAVGWGLVYLFLYFLYPLFFKNPVSALNRRSLYSLGFIITLCIFIFGVSFSIKDTELSNRVLHIFGGGFLGFLACFLVAKDTHLNIGKFQFFIFSFLVVISLGAANEMLEYFLQNYLNFSFAKTANDTWLDLINNSIGALIASIALVPFIRKNP